MSDALELERAYASIDRLYEQLERLEKENKELRSRVDVVPFWRGPDTAQQEMQPRLQ